MRSYKVYLKDDLYIRIQAKNIFEALKSINKEMSVKYENIKKIEHECLCYEEKE